MPTTRSMVSAGEAAAMLGVSRRSINRWAREGKLAAEKLPGVTGALLIDRDLIEEMVSAQTQATTKKAALLAG